MAITALNNSKLPKAVETTLTNTEFVILDIETSGLSPDKGGRIIEIGAIKVKDNEIISTYSQLIYPEQKIYKTTIELTGITNEMLLGKPIYGEVLPNFYNFIGNSIVVAHNAIFDWDRFLKPFFLKVGINADNTVVDTMHLSKYLFPNNKKHNLAIMCETLGVINENHHRAVDDALATTKALLKMKKMLESIVDKDELLLDNQVGMFSNSDMENDSSSGIEIFKIIRISCWQKSKSDKNVMKRIYVTMDIGTAYFDIHTRLWGNKDIKEGMDFKILEPRVIRYLKLSKIEDMDDYFENFIQNKLKAGN